MRDFDSATNVEITDQLIYRPRTKDNRQLYELLLSKINMVKYIYVSCRETSLRRRS